MEAKAAGTTAATGFGLINKIRDTPDLRPLERLLLLELAFHKNSRTGRCNPGQKRLADRLEISVSGVRKTIEKLTAKGLLCVKPGIGKHSTEYHFALDKVCYSHTIQAQESDTRGTLPLSLEGHSSDTRGTLPLSLEGRQTVLEQRKEQSSLTGESEKFVSQKGKRKKSGTLLEPDDVFSVGDVLTAVQPGQHFDVTSPAGSKVPQAVTWRSPKGERAALLARQDEEEFKRWAEELTVVVTRDAARPPGRAGRRRSHTS